MCSGVIMDTRFSISVKVSTAILLIWMAAQAGASEWMSEETISGYFIDKNAQTGIWIGRTWEFDTHIKHEDGPSHMFRASTLSSQLCRDPVTGLDNLFLRISDGKYSTVEYWFVDPTSQSLKLAYSQNIFDGELEEVEEVEDAKWVSSTGACRWRELDELRTLHEEAFVALGVTNDFRHEYDDGVPGDYFDLPIREIADDTVHHSLATLTSIPAREMVAFNLTSPAANVDEVAWLALKITSPQPCGPSVLLVQDRVAGAWQAIYAVEGKASCTYHTRIDEVHMMGDKLFIRICYECGVVNTSWQAVWLEVNPGTNRAVIAGYDRPEFVDPPNEDADVELALLRENCERLQELFAELNHASQENPAITIPSCTAITMDYWEPS